MKSQMAWMCVLLFLVTGGFRIAAQHFPKLHDPPGYKQFAPQKPIKSAAQIEVEKLLDRTRPGYYAPVYAGGKWLPARNPGATLRTTADCAGVYLCSKSALPVTLISFEGVRVDAGRVKLQWKTSSETNNKGFEIERGATATGLFLTVGFVDGSGNTVHSKTYEMTDLNNSTAVTYYRLKQIDYDGKFEYSRIVAVKGFEIPLTLIASPNPSASNNHFELVLNGYQKSGNVDLSIVDAGGATIYRNEKTPVNAAGKLSPGKIPRLVAGMYHARVVSGQDKLTVSFVVNQ